MITIMSIGSKSSLYRYSLPAIFLPFSTTNNTGSTIAGEDKNLNRILVKPPVKQTGPRQPFLPWLKAYLRHTLHACKLSYRDGKAFFGRDKKATPSLTDAVRYRDIKSNLFKLVPFSFFIVIPLAELLITEYLVFYQKAIPTRFLTQKGIDKTNYKTAIFMQNSQKKIRQRLLSELQQLQNLSIEDTDAISTMSNWLKNGINFKKDADQLTRLNTVFTKRVWPIIARDGILIREYMFAVGLRQLTGLYYINSLLAKISIEPITLASPVLRSVFKFFPRFRVYNHLKDVAKIDAFMTKEGIEGLSANQTVDLAAERGIVTLGKTERTLKNNLTDWYNHKGLGLSNYFMTFINICGRSPNN